MTPVAEAPTRIARSPKRPEPLLCELHAHTTWSDGELSLPALVDLYGQAGFDVLCVTDHAGADGSHLDAASFPRYLGAIAVEANRARAIYDMLLLPGVELTYDNPDPLRAAHVVAVGLETFVPSRTDSRPGSLRLAMPAPR